MKKDSAKKTPSEFDALGEVLKALTPLSEEQRAWVVASAVSNLKITASMQPAPAGGGGGDGGANNQPKPIPGQPGTETHARAFLREKKAGNETQQIACLAYYLTHHMNTPHFKTKDITKTNRLAGGAPIGNPSQRVADAGKVRFLSPAGGGKKLLSTLGEDVVNALPDQEAVKAVVAAMPKRKKKKRVRAKK